MTRQRYVTQELTHFVGRALESDDERFETLIQIVGSGRLAPGGEVDDNHTLMVSESGPLAKGISTNELFATHTVCFCDIPLLDLGIHIDKYGPFGITFKKSFLVGKGASPVFYVAAGESSIVFPPSEPPRSRSDVFDEEVNKLQTAVLELMECVRDAGPSDEPDGCYEAPAWQLHGVLHFFLSWHILFFLKFFYPALNDDHAENFYMEREWRTLGQLRNRRCRTHHPA